MPRTTQRPCLERTLTDDEASPLVAPDAERYLIWRSLESPHNGSRQLQGDEKTGRIEVIFPGLIDDANVALSIGLGVLEYLINLADLEVLRAAIFYVQRERPHRLLKFHGLLGDESAGAGQRARMRDFVTGDRPNGDCLHGGDRSCLAVKRRELDLECLAVRVNVNHSAPRHRLRGLQSELARSDDSIVLLDHHE
jgi:hypothetical protein